MRYVGLMVTPGDGYRSVEISDDMTVAQLITAQDLYGRSIVLDGEGILPEAYKTRTLEGVTEIWATGAVKGA